MDREEAIRVLTALPPVRIGVTTIGPTDVIVIECDRALSTEMELRLKQVASDAWPGRKVLVLGQEFHLRIVRDERRAMETEE